MKTNLTFITINLILSVIFESIPVFPWWTFLLMSLVLGVIYSFKRLEIKSFKSGFLSGSINWLMATVIFHSIYNGMLMEKVASIFSLPYILFILIVGVIGGLLNGLACYTGYVFIRKEADLEC